MADLKSILLGAFLALFVVIMVLDHFSKTSQDSDQDYSYYEHLNYDDDNVHLKHFQLVRLQTLEGELETDETRTVVVNDHGNLKIELISTLGDCDLYAVEGDVHKDASTYAHDTLKSVSFDKDFIYVGDFVRRPVTIIVHSHPDQLKCAFKLTKYLITSREAGRDSQYNGGTAHPKKYQVSDLVALNLRNSDYLFFYLPNLLENFYFKQQNQSSNPDIFQEFDKRETAAPSSDYTREHEDEDETEEDEEHESLLWTVFIHLVTFLAEALL